MLLYADDIVLIAGSVADLQRAMRIVTKWGSKWQCRFNRGKSNVVVYGSRKITGTKWILGGGVVEEVDSYKYLGMDIKGNLAWNKFRKRLLEKAKKNMNKVWAMGLRKGRLSVRAASNLWQVLVRPILEQGAENMGEGEWEEAEKLQREVGRELKRVKLVAGEG